MKYCDIVNSDLKTSAIVLGSVDFGGVIEKDVAYKMIDEFLYEGGNHIDTANVYGGIEQLSERTIGEWFKNSGKRQEVLLSTKGAHPKLETMNVPRMSKEEINSDLEASLRALQTDYIDLYWLHRDDTSKSVAEILRSLNDFVKEGKIRYIGCSNWNSKRIEEANKYAKENGLTGFCSSQIKWSIAKTNDGSSGDATLVEMGDKEYEYYLKNDVAVFAYSSQAKGFFTKLEQLGVGNMSQKVLNRFYSELNLRRYKVAHKISTDMGVNISSVVLSYITCRPFQSVAIVGCRTPQQLNDSLAAKDFVLSDEQIKAIDKA